jgi:hypothetical protein
MYFKLNEISTDTIELKKVNIADDSKKNLNQLIPSDRQFNVQSVLGSDWHDHLQVVLSEVGDIIVDVDVFELLRQIHDRNVGDAWISHRPSSGTVRFRSDNQRRLCTKSDEGEINRN